MSAVSRPIFELSLASSAWRNTTTGLEKLSSGLLSAELQLDKYLDTALIVFTECSRSISKKAWKMFLEDPRWLSHGRMASRSKKCAPFSIKPALSFPTRNVGVRRLYGPYGRVYRSVLLSADATSDASKTCHSLPEFLMHPRGSLRICLSPSDAYSGPALDGKTFALLDFPFWE